MCCPSPRDIRGITTLLRVSVDLWPRCVSDADQNLLLFPSGAVMSPLNVPRSSRRSIGGVLLRSGYQPIACSDSENNPPSTTNHVLWLWEQSSFMLHATLPTRQQQNRVGGWRGCDSSLTLTSPRGGRTTHNHTFLHLNMSPWSFCTCFSLLVYLKIILLQTRYKGSSKTIHDVLKKRLTGGLMS